MIPEFDLKRLLKDLRNSKVSAAELHKFIITNGAKASVSGASRFLLGDSIWPRVDMLLSAVHFLECKFDDYLIDREEN